MKKKILICLLFAVIVFGLTSISKAACSNCEAGRHATCTKGTNYKYRNSERHWHECKCCGTTWAAGVHSWNRSSASCTSAKKCTKCGHVAESAKGHYQGTAATCTKGTVCGRCGKVYKNSGGLGHTGGTATCTKGKLCTRVNAGKVCGKEYTKPLGHTGGEETCTKGKLCTRVNNGVVCGVEYTKPLGHNPNIDNPNAQRAIYTMKPIDYTRNAYEHWKTCLDCGAYVYPDEHHYYKNPDNAPNHERGAICEVCEEEYGNPIPPIVINPPSPTPPIPPFYPVPEGAYPVGDRTKVNPPELVPGMVPVIWQGTAWITTHTEDPLWYNYSSSQNNWANVMLTDGLTYYESGDDGEVVEAVGTVPSNKVIAEPGSMYVWVPRYTYAVNEEGTVIDYMWSTGIEDYYKREVDDSENILGNPGEEEYEVKKVPAFFYGEYLGGDPNDNSNYINRNGVDNELTGIWVSKFLASEEDGKIVFKPNKEADISKTIGEAYVASKDMLDANYSEYGITGKAESHLMKNQEWEAVSILTYKKETSPYKTIPYNNSSNGQTGYAGGTQDSDSTTDIYAYDEIVEENGTYKGGIFASTTHNMTGIYDMSGVPQYVAGYLYGGDTTNGKELTYIEEGLDVDKYLEEYTHELLGEEDDIVVKLTENNAFVIRGGDYREGNKSGIYGYEGGNGGTGKGYRNVIIPIDLSEGQNSLSVLEAKDSIQEGDETIIELLINSARNGNLGMSKEELKEALAIKFEQKSKDRKVITEDINVRIVSINGNETINENTEINEGINNSIKIKVGGEVNGVPVFRYVKGATGKIIFTESIKVNDEEGNEYELKNIKLGTAEIDVIPKDLVNKTSVEITKIEIEKLPYKMIAPLDLEGGVLKVERANGSIEYIDMTSEDITNNVTGNTVTLTYERRTITFNLDTSGNKTYVKVEGGEGSGTYEKGEVIKLYYHPEEGNKFVSWGSGNITSNYTFYTVPQENITLEVNTTKVSRIEVERKPSKEEYIKGEKLDLRGGRIKVYFVEGEPETVDMVCENVYVTTEGSFTRVGENTVYVFYGDESTSFTVNVR